MQLWGKKKPEETPDEFWRHTGEKRGGTVEFYTFATLVGRSASQQVGLPGLLYTVGDSVWFEDFERDNWLAKILNSRQKYEKTEAGFAKADIAFVRTVSRRNAYRCIVGSTAPDSLRQQSPIARIFSTPVTEIGFKDGTAIFFEIMMAKELKAHLGLPKE